MCKMLKNRWSADYGALKTDSMKVNIHSMEVYQVYLKWLCLIHQFLTEKFHSQRNGWNDGDSAAALIVSN